VLNGYFDPNVVFNFISFYIEYQPLDSVGSADVFNELVKMETNFIFKFVIDRDSS
jgi:hypothetical protein